MAVRIRLMRRGATKKPYYWIVAASSEAPRDGRFIDRIGTYDPLKTPAEVVIRADRLQYWMEQGAKPTETVASLIRRHAPKETPATS